MVADEAPEDILREYGDENWAVFDNRLYVRGSAKVRPLPEE